MRPSSPFVSLLHGEHSSFCLSFSPLIFTGYLPRRKPSPSSRGGSVSAEASESTVAECVQSTQANCTCWISLTHLLADTLEKLFVDLRVWFYFPQCTFGFFFKYLPNFFAFYINLPGTGVKCTGLCFPRSPLKYS